MTNLTDKNTTKMFMIDLKSELGDEITKEEREFFNAHLELMQQEAKENYEHWLNMPKFIIIK